MACQGRMYSISLFITISTSVVTSQVTNDVFGIHISDKACYGSSFFCTDTSLKCQTRQHVLISSIVYQSSKNFQGVSTCGNFQSNSKCCPLEKDITFYNEKIDSHRLDIYRACSGQEMCKVRVPHIVMDSETVTAIKVNYYCINESNIINYCEEANYINTTVHIMYNGTQDHHLNSECYCSIQAESVIDLYSVDIRIQKQNSTSQQCTNTTLKWGYNQTENVEKCTHSGDISTLRKLTATKDMWVRLSIQDKNPTMVWIAAKATSGTVNVTCGQRNVNTQGTTSTLSTTSTNTTINTKTNNISSAITLKSYSGSTTVPGSAMSPAVSTTVHLHESSTNTTVAVIKPNSRNTVSDDDTNIGAIVGPVIAIIIIAVLVVICLIILRRRRAKQQSSQSNTTRAYEGLAESSKSGSDDKASAYDIISDYDISKPIVLPTGSKVTNGEPVALSASLCDSYKQGDENAISDVVNDMYSDINPKDMVSDDSSRNDNSESDYNHIHGLKACETDVQSGNVYSHLKTSLKNTSPSNDGYDHFGCNKPNLLNENIVSSLSSNDYDHLSSAKTNNITDCNQPITTHIQQATTQDATVKTSGNSNTTEGFITATTSQQIEPSCEYAKVKRGKPVAASDYEMAGILNDVEV